MTKENKNIRGSKGCFVGSTRISIPDGYKEIDSIVEGDIVLSFDDRGKIHEAKVLKVHKHEDEEIWLYKFWGGESFTATPNHWVLNQFNAFVEIGTLENDDCVVNQNNHLVPLLEKKKIGVETVYNLTVENQHTFIAENIRVHNAGLGAGIQGAGGGGRKGGGGGRTPVEDPDSLQNTQYARVLDLISEGEIDGIEGGAAGIFLDNTPLNNFDGYTFETRTGSQTQTYISAVEGIETTTAVNTSVTVASGPVTRQITANTTDRVRIEIQCPSLQIFKDNGDVTGHSVEFTISVQFNGGGFNVVRSKKISGKSSGPFSKSYIIGVGTGGSFPVDIKVTRTSADETSAKRQNTINWRSFTTIIDEKLRYPNSALNFLELDARNFNNVPERRFLIRGIKVQTPHNASVDTTTHLGRITYSGLFNGTLGAATWTNDPAWILYDLLRNDRYGCGIDAAHLDVFDFYAISQYCNELVTDGKGGQEPRFSLNCVLNTRKEVFTVIKDLVNIFRGLAFFSSGSFVIKQDKPTDSSYVLNNSNVIDGYFEYNGTSIKSRHTCVTVAYQSYDMNGEVQFERVEDADAVRVYGVNHKEVKSLGCYSQGQANRLGRWILETERYLTQTVAFSVSIDSGLILIPSMVVSIADSLKTSVRRGGRIKSATTTAITIDSKEDIGTVSTESSQKIMVVLPTGLAEERTISSVSSASGSDNSVFVMQVSSAFSQAPAAGSFYAIETNTVKLEKYRILRVTEEEDRVHSVTALLYDPDIYGRVDTPVIAPVVPQPIGDPPNAITDLIFETFYYEEGSSILLGCDVTWVHDGLRTVEYKVSYKIDDDNFMGASTLTRNLQLRGLRTGTLTFAVGAFNNLGGMSPSYEETHVLSDKTTPPENVTNLSVNQISGSQAVLKWSPSVARDVISGGYVVIKHSTNTNDTFDTAASIDNFSGSSSSAIVPAITGKYFAKFENILGVQSATAASVEFTLSTGNRTLIYDRKEDTDNPTFQGTYTNTEKYTEPNYASPLNGIVLKSNSLWDSVTSVDALTNWDFPSDILSSGEYLFDNNLDLEGTYEVLLERRLAFTGFNVDTGAAVTDVDAEVYVRTTTDDPDSGSASFTAWQPFTTTIVNTRGFEFKVVLTSTNVTSNICITQLGVRVLIGRKDDVAFLAQNSGTSTKAVTFASEFFAGVSATINGANAFIPAVSLSLQNGQQGDFFTISNRSKTGFSVLVQNNLGNNVDRQFTYQANGLG